MESMKINTIKACPLLGVRIVKATIAEKTMGMCDVNETFECMGEECINFVWDDNEGYCGYFQRYTNHQKEGKAEK